MDASKRNFMVRCSAFLGAIVVGSLAVRQTSSAQNQKGLPAPQQSQQGTDGTSPTLPSSEVIGDPKEMLKHHQLQIHDDVEKLYEFAGELKAEVEKTQTEHVLSLAMIQKAEQIEKLAKQVKTMARES